MNFIVQLETDFNKISNPKIIESWEKYMKNNFKFLGVITETRREILKRNSINFEEEIKNNFREISCKLFNKQEREFHYCGQEILYKYINKNFKKDDILLIEKMITTNSWWDSVDFIAKNILGNYVLAFPDEKYNVIEKFSNSANMWLNRSAIIFQLSYKKNTDFELLISECERHKTSKEFFIQKAIGWALRDYSRFNPNGVQAYVNATNLMPLSKREALRKII